MNSAKQAPSQLHRASALELMRMGGLCAVGGVIGFVLVVGFLEFAQPEYDSVNQMVSELVFGRHGGLVVAAFISLGVAMSGISFGMIGLNARPMLRFTAQMAAMCFAASGVFLLGGRFDIHLPLVGAGFVCSIMLMTYAPFGAAGPHSPTTDWRHPMALPLSWGLAALMAMSVLLGYSEWPIGVARRLAAGCLMLWLVLAGTWMLQLARRVEGAKARQQA